MFWRKLLTRVLQFITLGYYRPLTVADVVYAHDYHTLLVKDRTSGHPLVRLTTIVGLAMDASDEYITVLSESLAESFENHYLLRAHEQVVDLGGGSFQSDSYILHFHKE